MDTPDINRALSLAKSLKGLVGGIKLGKEFFTACGPQGAEQISALGMPIFIDLKFHDIPNTVAGAVRSAVALKPFMLNVHASGGRAMMIAAVAAAKQASKDLGCKTPLVIGVTVLTSMNRADLAQVGIDEEPIEQVVRLALLAKESGLDGVVCSAREVVTLRGNVGPDFKLVVPGIRPTWASTDDQKRVVTPRDAMDLGADYLVIGRPITGADDPALAAKTIAKELSQNQAGS